MAREVDPFAFFAYQYVDQLLQLFGARPQSVFGRILPPSTNEPAVTAFTLAIGFEPGIDALIDVNLESGAVLQTGWMLAGARGSYGGGRIYLPEASGEISDAPAPLRRPICRRLTCTASWWPWLAAHAITQTRPKRPQS